MEVALSIALAASNRRWLKFNSRTTNSLLWISEPMNTHLIRVLGRSLASQSIASFGLYSCMVIYVLLWIFRDYQAYLLALGFVLKAVTIPYFHRIGERPVVLESAFLMVADVVGISLNLGAAEAAASECRRLFGF
jgi:hypothetical protein